MSYARSHSQTRGYSRQVQAAAKPEPEKVEVSVDENERRMRAEAAERRRIQAERAEALAREEEIRRQRTLESRRHERNAAQAVIEEHRKLREAELRKAREAAQAAAAPIQQPTIEGAKVTGKIIEKAVPDHIMRMLRPPTEGPAANQSPIPIVVQAPAPGPVYSSPLPFPSPVSPADSLDDSPSPRDKRRWSAPPDSPPRHTARVPLMMATTSPVGSRLSSPPLSSPPTAMPAAPPAAHRPSIAPASRIPVRAPITRPVPAYNDLFSVDFSPARSHTPLVSSPPESVSPGPSKRNQASSSPQATAPVQQEPIRTQRQPAAAAIKAPLPSSTLSSITTARKDAFNVDAPPVVQERGRVRGVDTRLGGTEEPRRGTSVISKTTVSSRPSLPAGPVIAHPAGWGMGMHEVVNSDRRMADIRRREYELKVREEAALKRLRSKSRARALAMPPAAGGASHSGTSGEAPLPVFTSYNTSPLAPPGGKPVVPPHNAAAKEEVAVDSEEDKLNESLERLNDALRGKVVLDSKRPVHVRVPSHQGILPPPKANGAPQVAVRSVEPVKPPQEPRLQPQLAQPASTRDRVAAVGSSSNPLSGLGRANEERVMTVPVGTFLPSSALAAVIARTKALVTSAQSQRTRVPVGRAHNGHVLQEGGEEGGVDETLSHGSDTEPDAGEGEVEEEDKAGGMVEVEDELESTFSMIQSLRRARSSRTHKAKHVMVTPTRVIANGTGV